MNRKTKLKIFQHPAAVTTQPLSAMRADNANDRNARAIIAPWDDYAAALDREHKGPKTLETEALNQFHAFRTWLEEVSDPPIATDDFNQTAELFRLFLAVIGGYAKRLKPDGTLAT